jgi:outer membrane protein assembly factor BamB
MAQVIKLQCSNCGAPLNVQPEAVQVTCEYCKHVSLLHRPGQQAAAAPAPPAPQQSAPSQGSGFVLAAVVGTLATVGIGGAVIYLVSQEVGDAMKSAIPGAKDMVEALGEQAVQDKARFSDQPQLVDLDSDGVPEIIGLSSVPSGESWIAAYDGKTLKPRWKTAPLSKDASDASARRALVPGLVLASDALGKLQAYSDKTGQPAWAALIGERVDGFCVGEGFVRVATADRKTQDLSLENGKRLETPPPTGAAAAKRGNPIPDLAQATDCVPVLGTRSSDGPHYSLISWSEYDDYGLPSLHGIEGISAHRALWVRGTKRAFMLGGKSSGTSYPMVAAVDNKKVLWLEPVSGADPMTSSGNPTTQLAAFFGDKLAIPYEVRDRGGTRMALFEAATGKRLWDMPIHQKSHVESGLTMTADTIYYATWTGVYLIEVATGKVRAFLGQEF